MRDHRNTDLPLTTLSAARLLGVPCDTIRWFVRTGRLTAVRLENGQYLYTRADVLALAAGRAERRRA
jgi:excisionase family DNA binding protein